MGYRDGNGSNQIEPGGHWLFIFLLLDDIGDLVLIIDAGKPPIN
jgi:hypothetical protein